MRILTPTLTRVLPALALLAFCSGVHAQEASGPSASDSSVFSGTASDSYSDASGPVGASSNLSLDKPATSSLSSSSSSGTALVTDLGVGLLGVSLMSLFHGGSSSSSSGTGGLSSNSIPAVPEASSVVSFGLLLTMGLGGLVVATRKRRTA